MRVLPFLLVLSACKKSSGDAEGGDDDDVLGSGSVDISADWGEFGEVQSTIWLHLSADNGDENHTLVMSDRADLCALMRDAQPLYNQATEAYFDSAREAADKAVWDDALDQALSPIFDGGIHLLEVLILTPEEGTVQVQDDGQGYLRMYDGNPWSLDESVSNQDGWHGFGGTRTIDTLVDGVSMEGKLRGQKVDADFEAVYCDVEVGDVEALRYYGYF